MTTQAPAWVQPGEWTWRSFTAGANASHTILMVYANGGGFQYLIDLDWGEFASGENDGRDDAEALAKYVCGAVNELRTLGEKVGEK